MGNLRGILMMIASMAFFSLEDMFIKRLSATLPIGQILLMLGIGGAVVFALPALRRGDRLISRDALARPVLLRALGEMMGTFGIVSALARTPISSASAILQATPLVVVLGAALFMGEKVGWRRWGAILVGFAGVVIILRPGLEGFQPASLFAVLGVMGLALRDLATRTAPRRMSSFQLSSYGFAALIPLGAAMVLFGPDAVAMDGAAWAQMAGALAMGVLGYYGIVEAMRAGEVSVVTPFRYVRLLFALAVGVLAFGEHPDALTLLGGAVIIGSGLYTFARQRALSSRAKGR